MLVRVMAAFTHSFRFLRNITATCLLSASIFGSCGPAVPTWGATAPLIEGSNKLQRLVVFTHFQPPAGVMGEQSSCKANAYFFDPGASGGVSRGPMPAEGECRIFQPNIDLQFPAQSWLCVGTLTVTAGGMGDALSLCPSMMLGNVGSAGVTVDMRGCAGFNMGTTVGVSSAADIFGDVVTDLNLSVALPQRPTITMPIRSNIGPWPTMGDMDVRWESTGATSAIVTLEPRDSGGGAAPSIVCVPRQQGRVWVPDALIVQSGLRMRETRLRVDAYVDTASTPNPMAPTVPPYRLSGGFGTAVILQPNR